MVELPPIALLILLPNHACIVSGRTLNLSLPILRLCHTLMETLSEGRVGYLLNLAKLLYVNMLS